MISSRGAADVRTDRAFQSSCAIFRPDRSRLLLRQGRASARSGPRLDAVLSHLRRPAMSVFSPDRRQAARSARQLAVHRGHHPVDVHRLCSGVRQRLATFARSAAIGDAGCCGLLFECRLYGTAAGARSPRGSSERSGCADLRLRQSAAVFARAIADVGGRPRKAQFRRDFQKDRLADPDPSVQRRDGFRASPQAISTCACRLPSTRWSLGFRGLPHPARSLSWV